MAGILLANNVSYEITRIDNGAVQAFRFTSPECNATTYARIIVTNPTGTRGAFSNFFYTLDCPFEGQWGTGLECKACPQGAIWCACKSGGRFFFSFLAGRSQ